MQGVATATKGGGDREKERGRRTHTTLSNSHRRLFGNGRRECRRCAAFLSDNELLVQGLNGFVPHAQVRLQAEEVRTKSHMGFSWRALTLLYLRPWSCRASVYEVTVR